jgi:hypothetical protein
MVLLSFGLLTTFQRDTNIESAVRLLPFVVITIFFIMVQGISLPKVGYYMPYYFIAGISSLVSSAVMFSVLKPYTSNGFVYGISVLSGIGGGISQQAAYSVVQAKVPTSRVAEAVNFCNIAQIGAMTLGLTIASTIFQNVGFRHLSTALQGLDFSAEDIRSALAGAKSEIFKKVSDEVRTRMIEGIVKTIADIYVMVIAAGALLLVTSLLMRRERLNLEVAAGG